MIADITQTVRAARPAPAAPLTIIVEQPIAGTFTQVGPQQHVVKTEPYVRVSALSQQLQEMIRRELELMTAGYR